MAYATSTGTNPATSEVTDCQVTPLRVSTTAPKARRQVE